MKNIVKKSMSILMAVILFISLITPLSVFGNTNEKNDECQNKNKHNWRFNHEKTIINPNPRPARRYAFCRVRDKCAGADDGGEYDERGGKFFDESGNDKN